MIPELMASSVSPKTIKRLFGLSGNKCAFPRCEAALVDSASGAVLSDVCHIKSENPEGPRYAPNQTDRPRHAFENLVVTRQTTKLAIRVCSRCLTMLPKQL